LPRAARNDERVAVMSRSSPEITYRSNAFVMSMSALRNALQ
jgi:hypothetical protein